MDKAEQSLLPSPVLLLTYSVCTPFYEATFRWVLPLQLQEDPRATPTGWLTAALVSFGLWGGKIIIVG
jgi:hypothetical protein